MYTDLQKNGYLVIEPSGKDNTYFITKHTIDEDRMIWIKLKKTPEVEVKSNYKPTTLTTKETELVAELIGQLGYDSYIEK